MTTALYRRYRPDTFAQVIGQDHVTTPLRAALRANKVTHAYLFSGPRGCGKTTSARIMARCLNCAEGPTDTPCGTCDSCRELATGGPGSLDVVEIDAASHGGVDDARDLRERATFAPVRDRYKVFIIDEAHMVSSAGFNALLKLVEEPPEHVKFVFATTEPDKVIGTIRSRTHHYPFRLVPPDTLGPYLTQLCGEENISIDSGVIPLVMRAGGGSVRDTLSVLDQLMAGAVDGAVSYATAVALLGYTDAALLDQSVDALAGGDGAAAYRVIEKMVESGHDPRRFVEDLLQRLRDLLIISVAGDGAADVLIGTPADQLERMFVQARNWGPQQLSRVADLTDQALRSMTGATSPRLQMELLLGRILVPVAGASDGVPEAVPGMVGMAHGGAPRVGSSGGQAAGERSFGARQAREALARAREEKSAGQAGSPIHEGGDAPRQQPAGGGAPQAESRDRPAPPVLASASGVPTPHSQRSGGVFADSAGQGRAPVASGQADSGRPEEVAAQRAFADSTASAEGGWTTAEPGSGPATAPSRQHSAEPQTPEPHPDRRDTTTPIPPDQEQTGSERADRGVHTEGQGRVARSAGTPEQQEAPQPQATGGRAVQEQPRPAHDHTSEPRGVHRPDTQRPPRSDAGPNLVDEGPQVSAAPRPQPAESQGQPAGQGNSGRDGDLLRGRWGEVIERLSTLSRVVWQMVEHHGQLGGVDSSTAVIVLPTAGHVANFNNSGKAAVVEQAIHETTGLRLNVRAELGQSSGGPTVTTPGAPAGGPSGEPPRGPSSGGYPGGPAGGQPGRGSGGPAGQPPQGTDPYAQSGASSWGVVAEPGQGRGRGAANAAPSGRVEPIEGASVNSPETRVEIGQRVETALQARPDSHGRADAAGGPAVSEPHVKSPEEPPYEPEVSAYSPDSFYDQVPPYDPGFDDEPPYEADIPSENTTFADNSVSGEAEFPGFGPNVSPAPPSSNNAPADGDSVAGDSVREAQIVDPVDETPPIAGAYGDQPDISANDSADLPDALAEVTPRPHWEEPAAPAEILPDNGDDSTDSAGIVLLPPQDHTPSFEDYLPGDPNASWAPVAVKGHPETEPAVSAAPFAEITDRGGEGASHVAHPSETSIAPIVDDAQESHDNDMSAGEGYPVDGTGDIAEAPEYLAEDDPIEDTSTIAPSTEWAVATPGESAAIATSSRANETPTESASAIVAISSEPGPQDAFPADPTPADIPPDPRPEDPDPKDAGPDQSEEPAPTTSWTAAIPGGGSSFDPDPFAQPWSPPTSSAAPSAHPSRGLASADPASSAHYSTADSAGPEESRPTSRLAALRAASQNQPAPAAPDHVRAADDDSASLDDDDVDTSTVVGVAAVLDILGGTIIDTHPN